MVENSRVEEISKGLAMGLEINLKIRGQDLKSIIRGWKPGVYLLIDLPIADGDYLKVIPETTVSFRFVNEGNVFSCVASVMSFLKQPANLMILDFPTRYEKYPLRKNMRLSTKLPGIFYRLTSVKPEEKKMQHKATVLDISPTGALLTSKLNLESSSRIALSIKLSSMDKVTNILSIVKDTSKDKTINEESYYITGVQFQNVDEESKLKILNFINSNKDFMG